MLAPGNVKDNSPCHSYRIDDCGGGGVVGQREEGLVQWAAKAENWGVPGDDLVRSQIPAAGILTFGPRPLNMPGTRTVSRCAECGALLENLSETLGQCRKCGFELHSCKQCEHFDPSSRFECNQRIPERIFPKDKRNECSFFSMRVRLEKETSSKPAQRPNDARQAFENLFKK
jgi:hypothetical protein